MVYNKTYTPPDSHLQCRILGKNQCVPVTVYGPACWEVNFYDARDDTNTGHTCTDETTWRITNLGDYWPDPHNHK